MTAPFHRFYRLVAQIPGQRDLITFNEFADQAELDAALASLEARPKVTKASAVRINEATYVRETGRA